MTQFFFALLSLVFLSATTISVQSQPTSIEGEWSGEFRCGADPGFNVALLVEASEEQKYSAVLNVYDRNRLAVTYLMDGTRLHSGQFRLLPEGSVGSSRFNRTALLIGIDAQGTITGIGDRPGCGITLKRAAPARSGPTEKGGPDWNKTMLACFTSRTFIWSDKWMLRCLQSQIVRSIRRDELARVYSSPTPENCASARYVLSEGYKRALRELDISVPAYDISCETTVAVFKILRGWSPDWASCTGLDTYNFRRPQWLTELSRCLELRTSPSNRQLVQRLLQNVCTSAADTNLKSLMDVYLPRIRQGHYDPNYNFSGIPPLQCGELLTIAHDAEIIDTNARDQIAASFVTGAQQAQERAKQVAAQEAESRRKRVQDCAASGASEKEPNAYQVSTAIKAFMLDNCSNGRQIALNLFSRSAGQANPVSQAMTTFQRRGTSCVSEALTFQMALSFDSAAVSCQRERTGRFLCSGLGTFRCSTNATDPARQAFECAFWRAPLPIEVVLVSDEVCEWSVSWR